jgi:signal transduction histidine kinase
MSASSALRVLVIDDDADTRANLNDILELDNYQVETAGTMAEALARKDWARIGTIILDRRLPDGSAEELLPRLRRLAPDAAVIIVTGYADLEGVIAALRQGAADYILKPINADLLRSRLAGVAERKQAAEEIGRLNKDLQHRVNELQTLLDVLPVGIAIAQDPRCRRIRVNPAFARLLRLSPGANASLSAPKEERPPYRVFRNGKPLPAEEMPVQVAAGHGVEVREAEIDIVHPDGETITCLSYAAPLFDEHGRPRGAIGAFLDITERKHAQERALQTERLAAIGQMMTGLAHESGNALARSQSCLEMLTWEVEDRPEALDLINRIQKAQDHLRQLYEEVRSYAAPLKLEREPWDVGAVCRQAWENLALLRQGRDAQLRPEVLGIDWTCAVDPFRLEQVFRNMLENALAACTDPVRVTVSAAEATLAGRPALRVSVRDNGPGLSPEQRQRIFDPFFTTKTKGTGLGMAIAKRIIEAHGGQIAVGPSSGPGAEIVITLPREAP